jgi:hypothetical protein
MGAVHKMMPLKAVAEFSGSRNLHLLPLTDAFRRCNLFIKILQSLLPEQNMSLKGRKLRAGW